MGLYDDYRRLLMFDAQQRQSRRGLAPGPTEQRALATIRRALEAGGVAALVAAGIPQEWAEREAARAQDA
jgi:hypothetical protein